MNVDSYDVWVIKLNKVFLVGIPYEDTKVCRLSENVYDAAQIPDKDTAEAVAAMAGGEIVKFNPIIGRLYS